MYSFLKSHFSFSKFSILSADPKKKKKKASISKIRFSIPISEARLSPSLKAHNSARQLLVQPKPLEKPGTQFPSLLRLRPPPPPLPGFPRADFLVLIKE